MTGAAAAVRLFCFSGGGHSRAAADILAEELNVPVTDITTPAGRAALPPVAVPTVSVVVFPVYCQRMPQPVRTFLRSLREGSVVPVAVWGCVSHGDVLRQAQRAARIPTVAAAYIPAGHSYLPTADGMNLPDRSALARLAAAVRTLAQSNPQSSIRLPRAPRNPLSDLFPGWRSRLSVRLTSRADCDVCGICTAACPVSAMHNGSPDSRCIRCLRCVSVCPRHALSFSCSRLLIRYLVRHTKAAGGCVPEAELF